MNIVIFKNILSENEKLVQRYWHTEMRVLVDPKLGCLSSVFAERIQVQQNVRVDGDQHEVDSVNQLWVDAKNLSKL